MSDPNTPPPQPTAMEARVVALEKKARHKARAIRFDRETIAVAVAVASLLFTVGVHYLASRTKNLADAEELAAQLEDNRSQIQNDQAHTHIEDLTMKRRLLIAQLDGLLPAVKGRLPAAAYIVLGRSEADAGLYADAQTHFKAAYTSGHANDSDLLWAKSDLGVLWCMQGTGLGQHDVNGWFDTALRPTSMTADISVIFTRIFAYSSWGECNFMEEDLPDGYKRFLAAQSESTKLNGTDGVQNRRSLGVTLSIDLLNTKEGRNLLHRVLTVGEWTPDQPNVPNDVVHDAEGVTDVTFKVNPITFAPTFQAMQGTVSATGILEVSKIECNPHGQPALVSMLSYYTVTGFSLTNPNSPFGLSGETGTAKMTLAVDGSMIVQMAPGGGVPYSFRVRNSKFNPNSLPAIR